MSLNKTIFDWKAQNNINRQEAELLTGEIDKHEYLNGRQKLASGQTSVIVKFKFTYKT